MEIEINKKKGLPIYLQIKQQIQEMINKGILQRGERLPPERELSRKLKVSRNRVSAAYKELEQDGVLLSQQGKGTFVKVGPRGFREPSRKDKLLRIIDLAMDEAVEMGFSLDDFLTIAYVRAKEKEELRNQTKVAFIECSREQLEAMIQTSELDKEVAVIPVLMQELQDDPARIKRVLDKVEVIITTPFHLEEVEDFLAGSDKNLVDMTLEPDMKTIVDLARVSPSSKVGLVCQTESFASEVKSSLQKYDLHNYSLSYTITAEDNLEDFLKEQDIIITSPSRWKQVQELIKENRWEKQVINFKFSPDRGSKNLLKMTLLDVNQVD
ncbi:MAG: GntR family transcriptional regulator [Bacillota bacterium]